MEIEKTIVLKIYKFYAKNVIKITIVAEIGKPVVT